MKKMFKPALILLLLLTACGSSSGLQQVKDQPESLPTIEESLTPEPDPEPLKPGFVTYESTEILFQYPERFTQWSHATKDDPAVREAMLAKHTEETLAQALENYQASFYDYQDDTPGALIYPYFFIRVADASGKTMTSFREGSGLESFSEVVESQGEDFTFVEPLDFRSPGGVELLSYIGQFSSEGNGYDTWQAMRIEDEQMITFTYICSRNCLDDTKKAEIEEILATLRYQQ